MRRQFSILDWIRVTTCIGFVLCGLVSFELGFDDIFLLLQQLFTVPEADSWTGVHVETTGRAVLLGVAMGVALSHWMLHERLVGSGNEKTEEAGAPNSH